MNDTISKIIEGLYDQIDRPVIDRAACHVALDRLTAEIGRGPDVIGDVENDMIVARLTKSERRIAAAIFGANGRAVTKDALLEAISFDKTKEPVIKIVDVMTCKIRTKLRGTKYSIETVHSVGYRGIIGEGHRPSRLVELRNAAARNDRWHGTPVTRDELDFLRYVEKSDGKPVHIPNEMTSSRGMPFRSVKFHALARWLALKKCPMAIVRAHFGNRTFYWVAPAVTENAAAA